MEVNNSSARGRPLEGEAVAQLTVPAAAAPAREAEEGRGHGWARVHVACGAAGPARRGHAPAPRPLGFPQAGEQARFPRCSGGFLRGRGAASLAF